MQKLESILENETNEIICDFEIKENDSIQARWQDQDQNEGEKKNLPFSWFYRSNELKSKNDRNRNDRRILRPCQNTKQPQRIMKVSVKTIVVDALWNGVIGNMSNNLLYLDHSITEIG